MNYLDLDFSLDDLRRWGALEIYDEAQVCAWFGQRARLTIGEAMSAARLRPSILFWAVLRGELVDERLLHGLAVDLASALVSRIRAEGHYLDFRTERLLHRKRAWLAGQLTLGELSVARQGAMQARQDVAEIDDPAVWIAAKVVVQASAADGRKAFTDSYYTALEHDGSRAHQRAILEGVRMSLRDAADHWSMADPGSIPQEF